MQVRCPTCRKMVTWEDNPYRPFCSQSCRRIDLGRWANEEFILSRPLQEDDDLSELKTKKEEENGETND